MNQTPMKHFHYQIDGWAAFENLYRDVVRQVKAPAHFVEVGSWLGKSAAFMAVEIANSGKLIAFDCVDPWTDGGPDLRDTNYFQDLKEPVFDIFTRNIAPVRHLVNPMQMTSLEAAAKYRDHSIDFVMLDGDHSYEAVRADIDAWTPKMKAHGILSGDDYTWPGVKQAVDETFGSAAHVVMRTKDRKGNYKNEASYWWVQLP